MSDIDQAASADAHARQGIPPFVFVLTVCIGVVGFNSLVLGPIAPEVARTLGVEVPAAMTASAAFGLGTAASAVLLGRLIDRHGARRMLLAALALLVAGLAGSAAAPSLAVLVAAQLVTGVAAGIALPAVYTLAAAVAPPGRESETIGVVLAGWTLSMVAGVSLPAVAADFVSWRVVYVAAAAAAVLALGVVFVAASRKVGAAGSASQSPFAALRVRGAAPLLAACAAFMVSFYGVYAYLGDHLHRVLGLPLSVNGLAAVCYGAGFGAAAFLDRVIDRFDAGRLLPLLFVAVAAVYALLAIAAVSAVALLASLFLWGLINHFGLNVMIMRLTALDPLRRGAIMGLYSGVTYLALFAGTLGFGPLHALFGFAALPLAAIGLMLAAAAFAVIAARRPGAAEA